jgi:uncharacterized protein (TIGR00369 family)
MPPMPASPLDAAIGLHLHAYDDDGAAILRLDASPTALAGEGGTFLHGGALATCVDTAGWYAVVRARPGTYIAIDLRTDFLRLAAPGLYRVTGRALRAGRTLAVADVTIESWDTPGRPVAVGRAQYLRTGD